MKLSKRQLRKIIKEHVDSIVMKNPRKNFSRTGDYYQSMHDYEDLSHHNIQLPPVAPEDFDSDLDDDTREQIRSIRSVDDPSYSGMADELYSTMTDKESSPLFGLGDDYSSSKELYDKSGGKFAGANEYYLSVASIFERYMEPLEYDPETIETLSDELSTSVHDTVYSGILDDLFEAGKRLEGMQLQKIINDVKRYIFQNPDGTTILHEEAQELLDDLKDLQKKYFAGVGKRPYRRHSAFKTR